MKLSLKLHNKTYSVESDEGYDHNVYELAEQFKGLLVNAGFHPSNVDSIFDLDYQWFTDEENANNMQGHLTHSNKFVSEWHDECLKENSRAHEYHEQLEKEKKVEEFQNNMYKQ
jgi:Tat protein secretion system quality control protein TatD with DNase activity